MAATLLGPPDLYGPFARQATYKMVEGAGCTADGLIEGTEFSAILTVSHYFLNLAIRLLIVGDELLEIVGDEFLDASA